MRNELREQSQFMKLLAKEGFYCYKVKASKAGVPDIDAIRNDIIYKFEAKAKGGKLSELQKRFRGIYSLTYTVEKNGKEFHYWGKKPVSLKNSNIVYKGEIYEI